MKVLIIDDHALFREGLRYLLRSMTDIWNMLRRRISNDYRICRPSIRRWT